MVCVAPPGGAVVPVGFREGTDRSAREVHDLQLVGIRREDNPPPLWRPDWLQSPFDARELIT